jgi:uncharacterized protein
VVPAGATDNFIELRNVSDAPVDISGWQIQRCNNTGFAGTQVTVDEHVMAPGDHYLVAHTDFSGEVDPGCDLRGQHRGHRWRSDPRCGR